jgi:hypothetical protein
MNSNFKETVKHNVFPSRLHLISSYEYSTTY